MPRPGLNAGWIWVFVPTLLAGLVGLSIYLALPRDAAERTWTPQQAETKLSAQTAEADTAGAARPALQPAAASDLRHKGNPGSFRVKFSVFEDRRRDYSELSLLKDALTGKLGSGEGSYGEERPAVNRDAALAELDRWMEAHGLRGHHYHYKTPEPECRPDVIIFDLGHWGYEFTLSIFEQPRSVIDDLEQRLLKLKGSHDFSVEPGVAVYEDERHDVNTPPKPIQVRINGELYSAPDDFNEGENLLIRGRDMEGERAPRYMVFFSLDLHGPDRFGLGEIVRLGYDGDIQTYDTLVERWNHTPEQHQRLLSGDLPLMAYRNPDKTPRSVGLQLPDWLDESEFDPVAELEAIMAQENPVHWGDNPFAAISHEVRIKDKLARLSGLQLLKLAADPADAALEAAFMAGVDRWLDANPQYRSRNEFAKPVRFWAVREGGVLLELRCSVELPVPLPVAHDLAASLEGIPGLPEPWFDEYEPYSKRIKD